MFTPPAWMTLNPSHFNDLIAANGVRLTWQQAHLCPCTWNGPQPPSPDPQCQICSALTGNAIGYYYDAPSDPFVGIITFIHMGPTPDEPGTVMDEKIGLVQRSEPALTIPATAPLAWANASINDIFVELDAIDRFDVALTVGSKQNVPYSNGLTIAPSGAVTAYDEVTHSIIRVSGYTVSGTQVLIPNTYMSGTSYIVEISAAKTYVSWRTAGSIGHDRPFAQLTEPKRFRLQTLDLWLRGRV